ncbi:MAG TPA: hypothetical protein GX729_04590 [Firmicutes bacterium]|jgi:hypothetical protein|nr:hypothetical protein [Bacillota bacterium]
MKILGVEVNPYELFLILILLLGATGSFNTRVTRAGKKDPSSRNESPVKILSPSKRAAAEKPSSFNKRKRES